MPSIRWKGHNLHGQAAAPSMGSRPLCQLGVGPVGMVVCDPIIAADHHQAEDALAGQGHADALGTRRAKHQAAVVELYSVAKYLENDRAVVAHLIIHADV